jgi:hypothetical protein
VQLCPAGQVPQLAPHAGSGPQIRAPHWGVQQALFAQISPAAQQLFPHARRSQTHSPALQVALGGHGPSHLPPQPSSSPHFLLVQKGVQVHFPFEQVRPVGHGSAEAQSVQPLGIFLQVWIHPPRHLVAPAVH